MSTDLSRDELTALVAAAQTDGPRSLVAVLLLGLNGLRVSEVCTAVAEGLSTERGHRVLTIVGKGGRTARVPLAPRTGEAIDDLLAGRAHEPLLPTRTGRAMDRHAVWRLLRRLAATAVPDKATTLHPHDLRHAFVTLAWTPAPASATSKTPPATPTPAPPAATTAPATTSTDTPPTPWQRS